MSDYLYKLVFNEIAIYCSSVFLGPSLTHKIVHCKLIAYTLIYIH